MSIKVVSKILARTGRAFCRDIAKAAGIENAEAIKALLVLERRGQVTQKNGYWSVCPKKTEEENPSAASQKK